MKHSIAIDQRGVVTRITEQLDRLQTRIAKACEAAGRKPGEIGILGVSKRQPIASIEACLALGLRHFGENYLQEAEPKIAAIGSAHWHFIGQIQSNKTRAIASSFSWVQSIGDLRIATRLAEQRPEQAANLNVCLQVQAKNGSRGGVPPTRVFELADQLVKLPRLRLRGLMIMPLSGHSATELRKEFADARRLYEALQTRGHDLDTLSMGMSGDLEAAIQEGSTMLRIGTDLFGARASDESQTT